MRRIVWLWTILLTLIAIALKPLLTQFPPIPPAGVVYTMDGFMIDDNPPHLLAQRDEFYLYGIFDDHINILELQAKVRALRPGQILKVHINSPGGYTGIGDKLEAILRKHKGVVVGVVDHLAASAAADLLFHFDKIVIPNKESRIMFHATFAIPESRMRIFQWFVDLSIKISRYLQKQKYLELDFFTEEEIHTIFHTENGAEVWFTGEEFVKRLQERIPEKL